MATKLPLVGGHEGAGVVVALGKTLKAESWDYAGVKWLNGSCLNCEYCQSGAEPNCAEADLSGYTHMVLSNNMLLLTLFKLPESQLVPT